jgi:hypothetical protein
MKKDKYAMRILGMWRHDALNLRIGVRRRLHKSPVESHSYENYASAPRILLALPVFAAGFARRATLDAQS